MKIEDRKILAFVSLLFLFASCGGSPQPQIVDASKENAKPVAARISLTERDAAEPALAAAPDGGVYLVWAEHGAGKQVDVFFKKIDASGIPVGEQARINPEAGKAAAWRGDPPTVKVGADNTIYVGWTGRVEFEGKKGTNLYLSISRDGGKTFLAPVKVNDDSAPASHGMHSLAVDKDNRIYLAWLDERNVKPVEKTEKAEPSRSAPEVEVVEIHNGQQHQKIEKEESEPNSEVFYAVSNDGGKTFSANKKISSEVCPCCKTSMIAAPDGKVYLSWRQVLPGDFRHIAVAASENAGESFSAPVIVSDDQWQINACPISGAALASVAGDTLEVRWFTSGRAGTAGLYRAESKDGGKTFSPRTLISENLVFGTSSMIESEPGNPVSVYESEGKIFRAGVPDAPQEIAEGSLPTAVRSGDKLFVVFSRKENDKSGVWLAVVN